MTITALAVIQDSYSRCNRLSPGETLSADDAAFGFTRLNILVDEMSASGMFLYRDILTSASVSASSFTLGAGSWTAVASGSIIVSATADNLVMAPITMQQYNQIYDTTLTGLPTVYAQDGLSTVYLWPVPSANTIKIQTRVGVGAFADQTTTYTVPPGYQAALGASLAVRIAPNIIGKIPPELLRAELKCLTALPGYEPAVLNVSSFNGNRRAGTYPSILYGG